MKKQTNTTEEVQASTVLATDGQESSLEKKTKESKAKSENKEISFTFYQNAKITCACSTTFTVGSTKPEIHVEVCSNCHPFYTGQAKFVDTEGRVEAFRRREASKQDKREKKQAEPQKPERPKSLKEMLELLEAS